MPARDSRGRFVSGGGARVINRVDEVRRKYESAAMRGIDLTMAECVDYAKENHPGWRSVTGKAEKSIQIVDEARREGNGWVGRWGSQGVFYVLFLELKNGSFLRSAADAIYPRLNRNIRRAA